MTSVQTSEREPDLFQADAAGLPCPGATVRLAFSGVLQGPATVTMRAHDHGRALPVLVMELAYQGPAGQQLMHVEVPYPEAARAAADRRAAALKPGQPVEVTTLVSSIRLTLLDASFPTHH